MKEYNEKIQDFLNGFKEKNKINDKIQKLDYKNGLSYQQTNANMWNIVNTLVDAVNELNEKISHKTDEKIGDINSKETTKFLINILEKNWSPVKTKRLTFEEAMKFLREGHKISRRGCHAEHYLRKDDQEDDCMSIFGLDDLLCNDWEVRE